MNENEVRRESKVSKKVLVYIDKRLEEIISNERLTGAGNANAAVSQSDELLLSLSKERRALIRLLSNSTKSDYSEE